MSAPCPCADPCERILEEFFWRPIDAGSPPHETPLMRAYREEIDLVEDYQLHERYGCSRSDLLWTLMCAFKEVVRDEE